MEQPSVPLRDYVDALLGELDRRLDESARDREQIRAEMTAHVRRNEHDRLVDRVTALERVQARMLGGFGVIVLGLSLLGVVLRYVVG